MSRVAGTDTPHDCGKTPSELPKCGFVSVVAKPLQQIGIRGVRAELLQVCKKLFPTLMMSATRPARAKFSPEYRIADKTLGGVR
jgi:hypothetical protein